MDLFYNSFEKIFIIICLLLAIYYVIMCPCKKLLTCKKNHFLILLFIVFLYILFKHIF
jgi:hypothetical protein